MRMIKNILLVILTVTAAIVFTSHYGYTADEEEEEQEFFTPFYFPYTAESEDWFQPLYHPYAPEKKGWFKPFVAIRGEYDDNIYLTRTDKESDWITTLQPGFVIQPNLTKHKFVIDYLADLNFFAENDDENNFNHNINAGLQLNFNSVHLDLINMFHYFSDRSGSEDIGRIDRTQDYFWPSITFNFNKLDLSLGYNYRLEEYRTDAAIGAFKGQALTYKDLERDENEGTIEAALKFWPKTALLCSFDYGTIEHDTGRKSDSDYYDILVGLRGEPTDKSTVEARIGFRNQDYEDYDDDFTSVIFDGSFVERFTSRDSLRFDFKRITNDTIFQDNAYYQSTYIGANFQHGFTERLYGNIGVSYQRSYYPTETTLAGSTEHREDDFRSVAVGLSYKLVKWFIADIKYQYRIRDSNFSTYDYKNNRISIGLTGRF